MGQEEIFRLLLLVLLLSNESSNECSTYGGLNEIVIIGLLLSLHADTADDTEEMTTFP